MPSVSDDIAVLHVDDESKASEVVRDCLQLLDDRIEVETENDPTNAVERLTNQEFD